MNYHTKLCYFYVYLLYTGKIVLFFSMCFSMFTPFPAIFYENYGREGT